MSVHIVIRTVEAFTDFVPSAADDRTTEYTYDGSDKLLTLTARRADGSGQTTKYVYGALVADGHDVNSNELLTEVHHPDKTTGVPSTALAQQEFYVYNALGQPKKAHYDRNGTLHGFAFDVVGRQTDDLILLAGDGVDDAVIWLQTGYDTAGRPALFTSRDDQGAVVNEVERKYNGLGQLTEEYQCHSDTVADCSGGAPVVAYDYSAMSGGNHSRPIQLTYPDGREVNYSYGTANGLNDTISRLTAVTNEATTYDGYDYLGLGTVVRRWHQQGNGANVISLTSIKQSGESTADAGDQYIGLDRFGRVVDQRWIEDSDPSEPLDRFQYGYDRNSNRLYRDNLLDNDFDELYHANGASAGYDNLNQLAAFRRGALSDSNSDGVPDTVTTASRWQSWALDEQGNWDSVTTDGTGQTREHNAQNQVTDVGANELAYDNNGSTLTDENGRQYIYDAWNRLVEMKTSGGAQIARFSLDALNRRVQEVSGGVTKDFYYSASWQVLEEQHDGDVQAQYVWSPVYVDALVLRDRDSDGNGSLDERLYVQQDANWNVTAITNPSGAVQERYVYDPYGQPKAIQPDWTDYNPAQPEGDYDWLYLHQGGRFFRFDANAGTYYFRNRELSATLGRWNRQDPIGFEGGDSNLYWYVDNLPTSSLDPDGLTKWQGPWVGGAFIRGRITVYFGPWKCRQEWIDACQKKCGDQGYKSLGCIWIADVWAQVQSGLRTEAGSHGAITHCCCDYPKCDKDTLEKRRKEWDKFRDKFREYFYCNRSTVFA